MKSKWDYLTRLGAVALVTIKLIWDLTGDVVFGNDVGLVLDVVLIVINACIGAILWNDCATMDIQTQTINTWRTRATQAETNLLHLGRAVTDRLNARLMKPIDPTE